MNSLKAFLSSYQVITSDDVPPKGHLSVLIEDGQPKRIFDSEGVAQPFQVALVADPELLTQREVNMLTGVAQQSAWVCIVDHSNQVRGIIDPPHNRQLLIAARAKLNGGELGIVIAPPRTEYTAITLPVTHSLQEWWRQLKKNQQQYSCYAFFLCLPSDDEAIKYLTGYINEIDVLSGQNCLVVFLSDIGFMRSGYDKAMWNAAINDHIQKGYSVTVANLFKIKYTDFPCIVLFEAIDSPRKVIFSFSGLKVDELASQLRGIFTVVQQAVQNDKPPLSALESYQSKGRLKRVGSGIFSKLLGFAGKTFESAVDAWIKALIR